MTARLSPAMLRLFDRRGTLTRRPGDDDPEDRVFDVYGNEADVYAPIENPDSEDGTWAVGVELDQRFGSEDTDGVDVGTTDLVVFVEPAAPVRRTDRIILDDGTVVSLLAGFRQTGAGGAHHEYRGRIIS